MAIGIEARSFIMTKILNPRGLLAGMTLMAPALVLAWAPPYYGYGPLPPGQGGAPPDFPAPPTLPSPDRPGFPRAGGPLRFNQTVTAEGYVLEIPLDGLKAEDIQVQIDGRSLRLTRDTSTQKTREETLGNGQGYLRSYSFSSGHSSQRLPLPPDADGGALRREDGAERVRIIIPRRQN
jgi:hypothetical protein